MQVPVINVPNAGQLSPSQKREAFVRSVALIAVMVAVK